MAPAAAGACLQAESSGAGVGKLRKGAASAGSVLKCETRRAGSGRAAQRVARALMYSSSGSQHRALDVMATLFVARHDRCPVRAARPRARPSPATTASARQVLEQRGGARRRTAAGRTRCRVGRCRRYAAVDRRPRGSPSKRCESAGGTRHRIVVERNFARRQQPHASAFRSERCVSGSKCRMLSICRRTGRCAAAVGPWGTRRTGSRAGRIAGSRPGRCRSRPVQPALRLERQLADARARSCGRR